ncbi:hypothetical protein [Microbacterium soli]|uniref:Type VII secretion integral membrane protein EccD n=1 Tax=Microbacterium soli TaxID=446075 RepID=A0ABP7MYH8_9MICO
MSAKTIRLTVADAHSRHDLVVPADSTVADLFAVGGVDLSRYVGTTASGAALDLADEVSAVPGDGGVIWLFDRTAAAPDGGAARAAGRAAPGLPARERWTLLALLLTVASAILAGTIIAPGPVTISVSVAVLLAGALLLLAQPVRESSGHVAFVAPGLAAAGGALAVASFGDAGAMIAAGTIAGATAACARHARTRASGRTESGSTAVIAAIWSVVATVDAAAFLFEITAATIAAVQIAAAAPLFHYMRGSALDVDADDLLDIPFVIRDAPGIRARPPAEPAPVRRDLAAAQYRAARQRSTAGIVMACALALLSSLYALVSFPGGSVASWCVIGGTLGVGCYLLLASRRLRDGSARAAALSTGALVSVLAATALVLALAVPALLVAIVLVPAGIVIGCVTAPLSGGWRSLGWSRTGDILEGLMLALAPAALLYGSGLAGQILEVLP